MQETLALGGGTGDTYGAGRETEKEKLLSKSLKYPFFYISSTKIENLSGAGFLKVMTAFKM